MTRTVVVYDYGSGNVHSAVKALVAAGADAVRTEGLDGLFLDLLVGVEVVEVVGREVRNSSAV